MLEQLSGYIIHFISSAGYGGIFFLMGLGSSVIPFPSEVTLPFSGYLVHAGKLNYFFVVFVAALGDTLGSLVPYAVGYFLEEKVIVNLVKKHGKYILVTEHDYKKASQWFSTYGDKVVFLGKLIPGGRLLIPLPAGVFEMKPWKFLAYSFSGSLIWAFVLTYVGVYLGSKWASLSGYFRQFEFVIVVVIGLAILWYLDHKLHILKKITK